jgi:serine/threonine protein kinase
MEKHQTALHAWEATIKLVAAIAIAEYGAQAESCGDSEVAELLQKLARPSLGHWRQLARKLPQLLADAGDEGFQSLYDLFSRKHDGFASCREAIGCLEEATDGKRSGKKRIDIAHLLDLIVQYRNREVAHGALAQRDTSWYTRIGDALLGSLVEFATHCDLLARRRLVCPSEVHRLSTGQWQVQYLELTGTVLAPPRSVEMDDSASMSLPTPNHIYCVHPAGADSPARGIPVLEPQKLLPLHPLLMFDSEVGDILFLNARNGERHLEYLSYLSGRQVRWDELEDDQLDLLSRVLGQSVSREQTARWAAEAAASEPPTSVARSTDGAAALRNYIGEYEVIAKLGAGGMGDVYRAWQPSLEREVALKSMRHVGDAKTETRFLREIRALGQVDHPNLVRIYASGKDGERWYFAMEFVDGTTLADVFEHLKKTGKSATTIDRGALQSAIDTSYDGTRTQRDKLTKAAGIRPDETQTSWKRAISSVSDDSVGSTKYVELVVDWVRQVCDAAAALHRNGIVHRDIKPENIVISPDGRRAVLMDLGLAKFVDEDHGVTLTRQFVGTLRYASPEQVRSAKHLVQTSDVYSLGVLLWELLTLRPIHGISEDTSTPEAMQRIQYEDAEPLRKHDARLPVELEAIILKCLEKDSRRRYPDAAALAEELGRWQRREPVTAKPRFWRRNAKRLLMRQRFALSLVGTALGVAAVVWLAASRFGGQQDIASFNVNPVQMKRINRLVDEVRSHDPPIADAPHPSRQFVPRIAEPDWFAFETLETLRICDLRKWTPVPPDQLDQQLSAVVVILRERIRKRRDVSEIRQRAITSGLEVYMRCERNPDVAYVPKRYRVLASQSASKHGPLLMKPRIAILDISDVKVGEVFGVDWVHTYWNAYQRADQRFSGMMIRENVDEAALLVIMPTDYRLTGYRLQVTMEGKGELYEFAGPRIVYVSDDQSFVYWQVLEPQAGLYYQLAWDWEPRE